MQGLRHPYRSFPVVPRVFYMNCAMPISQVPVGIAAVKFGGTVSFC